MRAARIGASATPARSHEFAALYPEFERFRALRRELDPGAKFLNAHLRTIFD